MNKRKFYIITTTVSVSALIIFEVAMFCIFGEEQLTQNRQLRNLTAAAPTVTILLSFVRDYVMKKLYGNNEKDKK